MLLFRGENGPNLWRLQPSPTNADHTVFEWVLNTDVKGEIPKRLVERSMNAFLINYIRSMIAYAADYHST
jgi:hypothetical protein